MKQILFLLLLQITIQAPAQKGLEEMIAAEKSFAAYAVAHGTKEAFLQFIDTAAVMFSKGEPVNGYQLWQKKEKSPGVLNWWPAYAEIAASGDFGYTCGPWTFQPKTIRDSVIASGYFFTVWQKNKAGEWKFILDVGTDAGPMMKEATVTKLTKEKGRNTEHSLREAEETFLKQYKEDEVKAYREFMSDNAIIGAEKAPLKNGFVNWKYSTSPESGKTGFSFQGGGIAPSGDLGYAYGSATVNGKKETYLRIWRHELTGWKIALQMIRL